ADRGGRIDAAAALIALAADVLLADLSAAQFHLALLAADLAAGLFYAARVGQACVICRFTIIGGFSAVKTSVFFWV
uniref:hypothetical protein n=1 Tax=Serratia sp. ME43 TaxID=2744256 RepID=UPI0015F772F3